MLDTFVPASPAVMRSGETVEQRRGEKLSAKGVNRGPVRSPHTYPVKASGLCWVSLMMLACQALRLVRWLPTRELAVVSGDTYSALEWLNAIRQAICVITSMITHMWLDAARYAPAPPRK